VKRPRWVPHWRVRTWDDSQREEVWRCSCGDGFHTLCLTYDVGEAETYFDVSVAAGDSWSKRLKYAWNALWGHEYVVADVILTPRQLHELHLAIRRRFTSLKARILAQERFIDPPDPRIEELYEKPADPEEIGPDSPFSM